MNHQLTSNLLSFVRALLTPSLIMMSFIFFVVFLALVAISSHAFVLRPATSQQVSQMTSFSQQQFHQSLLSMTEDETSETEKAAVVECFLIENEDEDTNESFEMEEPTVVCTSEPEEYAWFNGIDEKKMKPTNGTETGATECVEGASPRGTPEWECK